MVLINLVATPGLSLRALEARTSPLPRALLYALLGQLLRGGRVRVHLVDHPATRAPCTLWGEAASTGSSAAAAQPRVRRPIDLVALRESLFFEPTVLALCEDGICVT